MAKRCLFLHKTIRLGAIGLVHHAVFDRKPVCRQFIHHRNVQVTVNDDCQCSRNRCSTHDQYMGMHSLIGQRLPLPHPKPMLFIRHYQPQLLIDDLLLDKRVSPDDDLHRSAGDGLPCLPLFLCRHGARQQNRFQRNFIFREHMTDGLKMLLCQHFGRHHKRPLVSAAARHNKCQHC